MEYRDVKDEVSFQCYQVFPLKNNIKVEFIYLFQAQIHYHKNTCILRQACTNQF